MKLSHQRLHVTSSAFTVTATRALPVVVCVPFRLDLHHRRGDVTILSHIYKATESSGSRLGLSRWQSARPKTQQ